MRINPTSGAMTFLLAGMTAIGPATMDIYLASLPHIGAAFGTDATQVQLTLSLYLLGFACGQIFYGPLSDALGRRPMLLTGFALYLVASAACAAASSIEMLIGARIVQGLGAAGPIIVARATVRDLHSGSQAARQLGLMSAIQGIAPICAPILGGVLQASFGWRSNFVTLEIVGALLAATAFFLLPETNTRKLGAASASPRKIVEGLFSVSGNRTFLVYVAVNGLSYSTVFAFLSGVSHVMQDQYHFTAVQFGLIYAMCSTSYIVGNAVGAQIVRRLRLEGMLRLGSAIAATGAVAQLVAYALLPGSFLSIVVPQMVMMFGIAFTVPQVIAAAMTPFPDRAGSASSLLGATQMLWASITGFLLSLMLGSTAWPMIAIGSGFALLIFTVLRLSAKMRIAAHEASRAAAPARA